MAQQEKFVPKVKLNNGKLMRILGLGTWNSLSNEVYQVVKDAIDAGYRHIDSALAYGNEAEIGAAVRDKIAEGVITREDMFIVTKLWNTFHRPDLVEPSLRESLKNFGLDYVDLYLIHMPMAHKEGDSLAPADPATGQWYSSDVDYVDTYKAMEELVKKGLTKSIGVSNFNKRQIERVLGNCSIPPVTNQVELHPYFSQQKLVDFCQSKGITITAFSQFGSPASPYRKPEDPIALVDPVIEEIAKKHCKSTGQVILRWLIQRNIIAIPKSVTKKRVEDNINIFCFVLSSDEMAAINALNQNYRIAKMDFATKHKDYPFEDEYKLYNLQQTVYDICFLSSNMSCENGTCVLTFPDIK